MPASNSYGIREVLGQLDGVGMAVALVLLLMSLVSWYLVFVKSARLWRVRRRNDEVVNGFWDASDLVDAGKRLRDQYDGEPAARLALGAILAAGHHQEHRARAERLGDQSSLSDIVVRALRQGLARENARLESGLAWLASIGATAPFVGLFGTVWGIYHALAGIGAGGVATLDKVAGPVGEALVMTAAGLAVAIPAVLAYNAFVRANRMLAAEFDGFAHDLHTYLTTGARLDVAASAVVPFKPAAQGKGK
jgi:biopolymer transport protein ExbB